VKVCEICICGAHHRTYRGQHIRVLCGVCHGTGVVSLGYESEARWQALREKALSRAIREGWFEEVWVGEPGQARRVVRLVGPAEFVQRTA
jgi:hypothetical protein